MTSLSRHVGIYRVRQGNGNARLRRTTAVPVERGSGAVLALRVSGSKICNAGASRGKSQTQG